VSNAPRSARLEERAAKLRQKELQRQLKEMTKLNEQQRARLEVEAFENELEVLLSVHKQSSEPIDWKSLAVALPPHAPAFSSRNHLRSFVSAALMNRQQQNQDQLLQQAWSTDESAYRAACVKYEQEYAEWARWKSLGEKILVGDPAAFFEAVTEFSSFGEIANLGAALEFKAHDSKRVECVLAVNGQSTIPSETKTLTSAGKLSVKAMPKARFHEIYQDYVCGCCLRIGREILSLLPVEVVLVTITVASVDSSSGHPVDLPVLSVLLDRQTMGSLNFESLDTSDSMGNFNCRGDVRISKKTGGFVPVVPHTFVDMDTVGHDAPDLDLLVGKISLIRAALRKVFKLSKSRSKDTTPISNQSPA
jgi:hypothetical protein